MPHEYETSFAICPLVFFPLHTYFKTLISPRRKDKGIFLFSIFSRCGFVRIDVDLHWEGFLFLFRTAKELVCTPSSHAVSSPFNFLLVFQILFTAASFINQSAIAKRCMQVSATYSQDSIRPLLRSVRVCYK